MFKKMYLRTTESLPIAVGFRSIPLSVYVYENFQKNCEKNCFQNIYLKPSIPDVKIYYPTKFGGTISKTYDVFNL